MDVPSEFNKTNTRDYFFGREGDIKVERRVSDTLDPFNLTSDIKKLGDVDVYWHFGFYEGPKTKHAPYMFRIAFGKEPRDYSFGSINYENGSLRSIVCHKFGKATEESMGPVILSKTRINNEFRFAGYYPGHSKVYLDSSGKEAYAASFGIDGSNRMILTQRHIPSGTIKVVSAPLEISVEEIRKIVFSKPPYTQIPPPVRGALPMLDVPWRNIDRIMGATLSYSTPNKKQEEN